MENCFNGEKVGGVGDGRVMDRGKTGGKYSERDGELE